MQQDLMAAPLSTAVTPNILPSGQLDVNVSPDPEVSPHREAASADIAMPSCPHTNAISNQTPIHNVSDKSEISDLQLHSQDQLDVDVIPTQAVPPYREMAPSVAATSSCSHTSDTHICTLDSHHSNVTQLLNIAQKDLMAGPSANTND